MHVDTARALIASSTPSDSAVLTAVVAASFLAVVEGLRRILDFRRRHHNRVVDAGLELLRATYQIDRLAKEGVDPAAAVFGDAFQRFDDAYRTLQMLADEDVWRAAQGCKFALKALRDAAGTNGLQPAREAMKKTRLELINALRRRLRKVARFARQSDSVDDKPVVAAATRQ